MRGSGCDSAAIPQSRKRLCCIGVAATHYGLSHARCNTLTKKIRDHACYANVIILFVILIYAPIMLVEIVIVIILAYYCATYITADPVENYKSCLNCDDDIRMLDGGNVVQNPFIWPYSGTADVGKIYQMNPEDRMCYGFKDEPLIHLNTPDHVILT